MDLNCDNILLKEEIYRDLQEMMAERGIIMAHWGIK